MQLHQFIFYGAGAVIVSFHIPPGYVICTVLQIKWMEQIFPSRESFARLFVRHLKRIVVKQYGDLETGNCFACASNTKFSPVERFWFDKIHKHIIFPCQALGICEFQHCVEYITKYCFWDDVNKLHGEMWRDIEQHQQENAFYTESARRTRVREKAEHEQKSRALYMCVSHVYFEVMLLRRNLWSL